MFGKFLTSPFIYKCTGTLLIVLATGCATEFANLKEVPKAIAENHPLEELKKIENIDFPRGDKVLLNLERGSLLLHASKYRESFNAFEDAKALMEEFYTIRLTELANYRGNLLERAQVLNMQLIAAMEMKENNNAAVIARQIDNFMAQIAFEKESLFQCLPLSWQLAAIAFAANKQYDSTDVITRKLKACDNTVAGLLPLVKAPASKGTVWLVLGEGFVGRKKEVTSTIFSRFGGVNIAWPEYQETSRPIIDKVSVVAEDKEIAGVLLQDLEPIISRAYQSESNTAKALAIAQATAVIALAETTYRNMSKGKDDKNSSGSDFLATLSAIGIILSHNATMKADIRAWLSQPRRWWVIPLTLPAGNHNIVATIHSRQGNTFTLPLSFELSEDETLLIFRRQVQSPSVP